MSDEMQAGGKSRGSAFEAEAQRASKKTGPVGEFWYYLRTSGKWWMAPIILSLLAAAGLLVLGTTAAAPFLYTLF